MYLTELFFGPSSDARTEQGRQDREESAKELCFACEYRLACLERAMVLRDEHGVWGGMTERERKQFRKHLRREGYEAIPEGVEFWAALHSFYRAGPGVL